MDLKQLECFVRVAELGSFTRAANAMETSQSALSRLVRQLELELRKHLLYRHGRGVTPTESGKRLLAHGRGILHQIGLARQELEDLEESPAGKVVIGLPPSVGKRLTVPLMAKFRTRYPKASVGIVEGLTLSMQEWLLLGRLDLAMLYNPAPLAQLEYERVWSEDLYLISPLAPGRRPRATVRLATLDQYPLIIPSRPHAIRNLVEAECSRRGVALNIALEVDAISSLLDLVEQGLGHAILSRTAVLGWGKHGRVQTRKIVDPAIVSDLVIATSTQRPLTRLARRAIELIKAEIAANVFAAPAAAGARPRIRNAKSARKRS
jgi:LysR family nitrogen assimilation transcriptional regulator